MCFRLPVLRPNGYRMGPMPKLSLTCSNNTSKPRIFCIDSRTRWPRARYRMRKRALYLNRIATPQNYLLQQSATQQRR